MRETTIGTNGAVSDAESWCRHVVEELRRANNLLCLWRVCGSAACRRARCCRGRAHLCAKRNDGLLPKPVHDFFLSFLFPFRPLADIYHFFVFFQRQSDRP